MKKNPILTGLALAAFVGLLAAAALPRTGARPEPFAADEMGPIVGVCIATATDKLAIRPEEQNLAVSTSEALPAEISAEFPADANVRVLGVAQEQNPRVVSVKVDASKAAAGSWTLKLISGETECAGEVQVVAAR